MHLRNLETHEDTKTEVRKGKKTINIRKVIHEIKVRKKKQKNIIIKSCFLKDTQNCQTFSYTKQKKQESNVFKKK